MNGNYLEHKNPKKKSHHNTELSLRRECRGFSTIVTFPLLINYSRFGYIKSIKFY